MAPPAEQALGYAQNLARVLATAPGGLELSAVIVHGSIGFGDFVAGRSDLDMLVAGELPAEGVAEVADSIIDIPAGANFVGLECSIVSRDDVANVMDLNPARPFRLHVNLDGEARRVVPGDGHAGDEDLTLHYAVARASGITVWGAPAEQIIPPQPRALIIRALLSELRWAAGNAEPCYAVLNAARALAFAHDGVMLSKLAGWRWARRHDGPAHLLDLALATYLTPQVPVTAVDWAAQQRDIDEFIDDVSSALHSNG